MFLRCRPISFFLIVMALPGCLANSITGMQPDTTPQENATGSAPEGQTSGSPAPTTNPDHLPRVSRCVQAHSPKPRGLRRLTGKEVTRTLQRIFKAADVPHGTEAFGGDSTVYGFDTIQSSLNIYNGGAVALQVYGESVGNYAAEHLGVITPCTNQDAACRATFIPQFGKQMFRRPLSADEVRGFDGLMARDEDFTTGLKAVVSAMVQSPFFLYRTELGVPSEQGYLLGPYEVASALSYLLTGSAPDAALMAAADANLLGDARARLAQAERLLATPQAVETLGRFTLQWLQVDDLAAAARTEGSTTLSMGLKDAMREEVRRTAESLWGNPNSQLRDIFLTPTTYINGELASFYGASGGQEASFRPVAQASMNRNVGVLGMGGVLAAASQTNRASPVLRGRMVRMRMLCGTIPSPPSSVPPLSSMAIIDGTVRGSYVQHEANPACQGCHLLMDPLGFPMGHYDTIGRRRPGNAENGIAVDTSGKVTGVGEMDVPLAGLDDLSGFLSTSDEAGACFVRHFAMYAYGAVSWPQDGCTHDDVAEVARGARYNLRATVLGLIGLPSFVTRSSDA